jgi:hypothetical protein
LHLKIGKEDGDLMKDSSMFQDDLNKKIIE